MYLQHKMEKLSPLMKYTKKRDYRECIKSKEIHSNPHEVFGSNDSKGKCIDRTFFPSETPWPRLRETVHTTKKKRHTGACTQYHSSLPH